MSLTQNDLKATRGIIEEAIEDSDQRTAAGFADVHEKLSEHDQQFAQIHAGIARIENKLDATIDRVDDHEVRLTKLEAKPA